MYSFISLSSHPFICPSNPPIYPSMHLCSRPICCSLAYQSHVPLVETEQTVSNFLLLIQFFLQQPTARTSRYTLTNIIQNQATTKPASLYRLVHYNIPCVQQQWCCLSSPWLRLWIGRPAIHAVQHLNFQLLSWLVGHHLNPRVQTHINWTAVATKITYCRIVSNRNR